MKQIVAFVFVLLLVVPTCESAQRSARGAVTVYSAVFSAWPTVKNKQGYVRPENGRYVLEASSNAWMGPQEKLPLNVVLQGDFSVQIALSVEYREDCSLNITLAGAGRDYSQLDVFLDIWRSGTPTFSAYEYGVERGFYANLKRRFAERVPVPDIAATDWRQLNSLRIDRQGNTVLVSLNGRPVGSFQAPVMPVSQLGVGIAFRSKVVLSSVTASIPGR